MCITTSFHVTKQELKICQKTAFSKIAPTHCGYRSRKEIDHLKEKEEVGGGCTVRPDLILQGRRKVLKSRVKGKGFVHVPAKIWGRGAFKALLCPQVPTALILCF